MNVVLIGYRGSGKTAVAKILAGRLGWDWYDVDAAIEERAGQSIAEISAAEGEEAFREMEEEVLKGLMKQDQVIVAAGGGAVLRAANRAAMGNAARVVWLQATPATLWRRIQGDPHTCERRPNLTAGGGLEEVETVLRDRTPLYRECADWEIDTDDKTPVEVAEVILSGLASGKPPSKS
jgi:shikimate kinase